MYTLGHRKKHAPHRGSLGFRRKRAKRHTARWRTWPKTTDKTEPKLLGFAGYKAGMTHLAMINTDQRSPFYKQEQFVPVTVLETPPIVIFGIRLYKIDQVKEELTKDKELKNDDLDIGL